MHASWVRSRRLWRAVGGAAALACAAAPFAARAQSAIYDDRTTAVGVLERPRPDYDALGVRAGAFVVYPSLTVSPQYDDNIFASTHGTVSDLVTALTPRVEARSDWSRNALSGYAQSTSNVYASHSREDTTDFTFGGAGRLDVGSRGQVSADLGYARTTEARTSENTITDAQSPIQDDTLTADVSASQAFNRIRLIGGLGFARYTYLDGRDASGNRLSQGYRDHDEETALARVEYEVGPAVNVFVSARGNDRPYDDRAAGFDRSSSGYELTAGGAVNLTELLRGQVQLGYFSQSYKGRDVQGPAARGQLEYFITDLTTVTLDVNRSVVDAADPNALSLLQTAGGVRVDHELLRNVILSGRAGYEQDVFQGIDRTDDRVSASLSGTYLLNRSVGLTAQYSLLRQSSSGAARAQDFTANVLSLSLVLRR